MKLAKFLLMIPFCLFAPIFVKAQAQYSSFEILSKGVSKDKYVAIKGEEIKANERYAYMFSNLSRYRVVVRPKDANTKVLIKILDKDKNEIVTNFHKKKYLSEINFKCGKTGMYYVLFEEIKS
jgi:hypothetical protein